MNPTLFTTTYQHSRGPAPEATVHREGKRVEVPQKVLRLIWDEQLLRAEFLRTDGGEALEIVFPGHWNFGPGPDFKNAAIKVNGKTLEGDVTLHVYRPGADVDPGEDYSRVVLSVYLWRDRETGSPRMPGEPGRANWSSRACSRGASSSSTKASTSTATRCSRSTPTGAATRRFPASPVKSSPPSWMRRATRACR